MVSLDYTQLIILCNNISYNDIDIQYLPLQPFDISTTKHGVMEAFVNTVPNQGTFSGVPRRITTTTRAPSQYKDRLSQVWGFPCLR